MKLKNLLVELIREEISLHENKQNISYNIDYITNNSFSDGSDIIYSIFGDYEEDLVVGLVNGCAPLKNNKITKAITGASYGKIFKLSNDHVLKLFSDSLNPEEDMEWYKQSHDKLFAGTANKNTLPVYDFGAVDPGDGVDIYFVEMAEVVPLDKWKSSGAHEGVSKLFEIYRIMKQESEKDKLKLKKEDAIKYTLFIMDRNAISTSPFTKLEAEAILGAFWEMEQSGRQLRDIAPRNMGILKQDVGYTEEMNKKPTIVIFDR